VLLPLPLLLLLLYFCCRQALLCKMFLCLRQK
jgi:hypothetical protein